MKTKYETPDVLVVAFAADGRICAMSDQQFTISDDSTIRPGFDGIEDL